VNETAVDVSTPVEYVAMLSAPVIVTTIS